MPEPSFFSSAPLITREEILAARSPRTLHDPWKPQSFFLEEERSREGSVDLVATVFLTNRECPYTCLMCDLWKNTTTFQVPSGAIVAQIRHALAHLPPATHIKLYNSGNFFDTKAVPPEDLPQIASLLSSLKTVIVENHPALCSTGCVDFQKRLGTTQLEVALGLETIHPDVLLRLGKGMTLDDFSGAVEFLHRHNIRTRAFILLRPPFLSEEEGREWAIRSIDYAFSLGVDCCTIIATRGGNGIMELLTEKGWYSPPRLDSLEWVLEQSVPHHSGRVFADTWGLERISTCPDCLSRRTQRMHRTNCTQSIQPRETCHCQQDAIDIAAI